MSVLQNYAFTWIGLSTASGQIADVPIVTRYLSLWLQQKKEECIWQNTGFLLSLDAGNHPIHPTGTVERYHCDWWNRNVPPGPSDIMNDGTLPKCVEVHRKYQNSSWRPKRGLSAMPSTYRQLAPGPTCLPCDQCASYRAVGMNTLNYLHQLRNKAHLHETCLENAKRNYMRRVATYNRLYEQAVLKETETPSATASGDNLQPSIAAISTKKSKTIAQLGEMLREHWRAEQLRLQQCPSLKWTWGVDITLEDISKMFRGADKFYAVPHSGYDCSLSGSVPGDSSGPSQPSSPNASDFSIVDANDVPLLSRDGINHHFSEYPLRRVHLEHELEVGESHSCGSKPTMAATPPSGQGTMAYIAHSNAKQALSLLQQQITSRREQQQGTAEEALQVLTLLRRERGKK